MSLQKFRNLEEARQSLVHEPLSPEHLRRLAALWSRASRLAPRVPACGVRKFRTIEEANEEREERLLESMRELRKSRVRA